MMRSRVRSRVSWMRHCISSAAAIAWKSPRSRPRSTASPATPQNVMRTKKRCEIVSSNWRFYLIEMHQFDDTISQRFFVRITFRGVAGEAVGLGLVRGDVQGTAAAERFEGRRVA